MSDEFKKFRDLVKVIVSVPKPKAKKKKRGKAIKKTAFSGGNYINAIQKPSDRRRAFSFQISSYGFSSGFSSGVVQISQTIAIVKPKLKTAVAKPRKAIVNTSIFSPHAFLK
jgi:hypothetical protein